MTATDWETAAWFAYKDEDGYWIESNGLPCLSLWTPLKITWEKAIRGIGTNNVRHLRPMLIHDPIYQYVRVVPPITYVLTPSDAREGPLYLQRLRYIKQNGAAYMVFPTMRSGRYEHSLGAMELASQIADGIFTFSDPVVIDTFARKVREDLGQGPTCCRERVSTPWLACFRQIVDSSDPPKVGSEKEERDESNSKEKTEEWDYHHETWANAQLKPTSDSGLALRRIGELSPGARHLVSRMAALHFFKLIASLVALLHDLGHLPFSHRLEDPFEDLLWHNGGSIERFPMTEGSGKKIHERISLEIIRQAKDLFTSEAWRAAVLLSLLADRKARWKDADGVWVRSSVFGTLHQIVSSDVDVDRLDFVSRDGYESGAAIGKFDLPRIIRSAVLHQKAADGARGFTIVFRDHGLGEIEALLFERFKLYRNILSHHKVMFFEAALDALFYETQRRSSEPSLASSCRCRIVEKAFQNAAPGMESLSLSNWPKDFLAASFFVWNPPKAGDAGTGSIPAGRSGVDSKQQTTALEFKPDFLIHAPVESDDKVRQGTDHREEVFFDDAYVIKLIRGARSCQGHFSPDPALEALAETFLLQRPLSLSLWKRPGDFKRIRHKLFDQTAELLNEKRLFSTRV